MTGVRIADVKPGSGMTPPLDRFDWERLVREIGMPPMTKLVALTLATYANGDGTRAHPGETKLAAAVGIKERAVRNHIAILRDLGLIKRVSRGGSRLRLADVYELHVPDDLLDRLDRHGWKLRHAVAGEDDPEPGGPPGENTLDSAHEPVENPAPEHDHEPELRHARATTPARGRRTPAPRCRPPSLYTTPSTKPLIRFCDHYGALEGTRARDGPSARHPDHTTLSEGRNRCRTPASRPPPTQTPQPSKPPANSPAASA